MDNFYYNLSGGINQASTKTELGINTKNLFWADAQNVEIYQNRGIIRQKGNVLFTQIPQTEQIPPYFCANKISYIVFFYPRVWRNKSYIYFPCTCCLWMG